MDEAVIANYIHEIFQAGHIGARGRGRRRLAPEPQTVENAAI
jgi:hypothetical protein